MSEGRAPEGLAAGRKYLFSGIVASLKALPRWSKRAVPWGENPALWGIV